MTLVKRQPVLDALDLAFSAHTPMLPALGISEYFPLRNARKDPRFVYRLVIRKEERATSLCASTVAAPLPRP